MLTSSRSTVAGLIGQIDRMLQRQIPDGEGLILGVAGLDAPAVLLVELAQAGGHFAGAGTGAVMTTMAGWSQYNRSCRSLVGDDQRNIGGVVVNGVVAVDPDAHGLQLVLEYLGVVLAPEPGHHHAAHVEAELPEGVDEPHDVHVVGDAQVAPALALLDVVGGDGHHQLGLVPELQEHPHLAVGLEARQHPGGVIVVK